MRGQGSAALAQSDGIALFLVSYLFFSTLDSATKWLALAGLPTGEIVFVRYLVHVVLFISLFLSRNGVALFRTGHLGLEAGRGLCLLITAASNFFALRYLPLTVATALFFSVPLMVCILAGPLLGERLGWRRWTAVGVGFLGVVIIVRPGTDAFHPAALLTLLAAASAAVFSILTRKLADIDSAATQQVYAAGIATIAVLPFAFTDWRWPADGPTWIAFVVIGIAGGVGHHLLSISHRLASPAMLAPFAYSQAIYAAVASWLLFSQPPDLWFYAGAPIVIGAGLYVWMRERAAARAATADASAAR